MLLAEAGFVTEAGALLRMVSDFATEAFSVIEGELRGKRTTAQQEFIDQFFERELTKPRAASEQGKRRYVSREELIKAHVRLGDEAGFGGERTRDLMRSRNSIYDAYIHGAYVTAMELYHGDRQEFMLRGHEGAGQRWVYQTSTAQVLHEVVYVFALMALVAGNGALHSDVTASLNKLRASGEMGATF